MVPTMTVYFRWEEEDFYNKNYVLVIIIKQIMIIKQKMVLPIDQKNTQETWYVIHYASITSSTIERSCC